MKTNFKFKTQLIAFAYVLLAVVFSSCNGVETPNINCNGRSFIVGEIKTYNDSLYYYTAKKFTLKGSEFFAGKQSVISKDVFKIGDTLRFSK